MRTGLLWVPLLGALLVLCSGGVAWAHVVVSPEEVPAGSYEKLTVTVPTEEEVPTTEVRVEVPDGFTVSGVRPVPSWEHEFEESGGVITAVTWSGGEIRPREFQEFDVQARTPEEGGEFAWRAFQTYEHATVAEWTGPPDAQRPASMVGVVARSGTGDHGA